MKYVKYYCNAFYINMCFTNGFNTKFPNFIFESTLKPMITNM